MTDQEEAIRLALEVRDWLKDADRSMPEVAGLLRGCDAVIRLATTSPIDLSTLRSVGIPCSGHPASGTTVTIST